MKELPSFDELLLLTDEQKTEKLKGLVDDVIDNCGDDERSKRLRSLQWSIDTRLRTSGLTGMARANLAYQLMLESFDKLNEELQNFKDIQVILEGTYNA